MSCVARGLRPSCLEFDSLFWSLAPCSEGRVDHGWRQQRGRHTRARAKAGAASLLHGRQRQQTLFLSYPSALECWHWILVREVHDVECVEEVAHRMEVAKQR